MSLEVKDLLDRIEDVFEIEDVLYIIGKDKRWLLKKLLPYIMKHIEDFGMERDDIYDTGDCE